MPLVVFILHYLYQSELPGEDRRLKALKVSRLSSIQEVQEVSHQTASGGALVLFLPPVSPVKTLPPDSELE